MEVKDLRSGEGLVPFCYVVSIEKDSGDTLHLYTTTGFLIKLSPHDLVMLEDYKRR